jgi:hypothetical protein
LALVATLFAPLNGAWACPDGTPCAATEQGFACVGGQCATAASCCREQALHLCRHGAPPAVAAADRGRLLLSAPEHCRFSGTARPVPVAVTTNKLLLTAPVTALPLLPLTFSAPVVRPTWLAAPTLGYRPPPLLRSGPSRAPPLA